jgi:hypothetical protein
MMLIPNAVGGLYNWFYNESVLRNLPIDHPKRFFEDFHFWVYVLNGIAFPVGIGIGIWLTMRVVTAAKTVQELRGGPKEDTFRMRRACLRLGEHAAIMSITLWIICGLLYPYILKMIEPNLPNFVFALFIGSLSICGLIAAVYPFFLVTYSAVHGLYPVFVQCGVCDQRDAGELRRLTNRLVLYFAGAMLVPLLAAFGVFLSSLGREQMPIEKITMFLVFIGGFAAAGVTYKYFRVLGKHLAALERVVSRRVDS